MGSGAKSAHPVHPRAGRCRRRAQIETLDPQRIWIRREPRSHHDLPRIVGAARDVAAERRQSTFQVTQIIWTLVGILEIALGLRFVLKLIAANPDAGFARAIYGLTQPFLAPFTALVGTPTSGGTVLEMTTLIAMAVYALLAWIVSRVIRVATDRPSSCLLYTSPSPRDRTRSRMPSSA